MENMQSKGNHRLSNHSGGGDIVRMDPYVTRQNQRQSLDGFRFVLWSAYKSLVFWKTVTFQRNVVIRRVQRKALGNSNNNQMSSSPSPDGGHRSRLDRAGSGKGSFSRLARRLSHKESRRNTEERKKALRQRSISLDCGDGRRAPLMTTPEPPNAKDDRSLSIPVSPSLPIKLTHSSPNLAGRLSRRASAGSSRRKNRDDQLGAESGPGAKGDKKRKSNCDIQALFDAVEHQDMERAQQLLESNGLDINYVNNEEMTPLDVAVMTNHVPMAKMLLKHGARENPKFQRSSESRAKSLINLVRDSERRIGDLNVSMQQHNQTSLGVGAPPSGQIKEKERMLFHWEFRHKLLKRIKQGYDHAREPSAPSAAKLFVASSNSLLVKFSESDSHNGAVVTRYKVEWSCFDTFNPLVGEQILDDPRYMYFEIPNLVQGNAYCVRVRAWNMKGFGPAINTDPLFAVPSSWREVDGFKARIEGKLSLLDVLFGDIKNSRPADASEIRDARTPGSSPIHPRKSTMRKSLKNLFSSAPKFQRSLKRGVYLSALLYNEDKVLVTNEEVLPIIEVDENYSVSSLHADFHWLIKIACTWDDVKSLRQDMDKSGNQSTMLFRSKLLQAAAQLQSALGVQDLGQFYYKPIKDGNGSIVLVTINQVRESKAVQSTHVKWMPLPKIQKRIACAFEGLAAPELLLASISEMMVYEESSSVPLAPGLYAGYLKLKSTVDLIRIMVPARVPNVLPHVKVRDTSNVNKEEWEWLRRLSTNEVNAPPSPTQSAFHQAVVASCKQLLDNLGVSDDEAVTHRVYDVEVIELSEEVSFILLLPPVENVCSVPGHTEEITQNPNYLTLPVQVFEMIHMCTYQYEFISRYSRLSSILEMDTYLAQQAQREAFSQDEIQEAKDRVDLLGQFQQKLDETWKSMRWTMDLISYARDKSVRGGLPLSVLYAPPPSPTESPMLDRRGDLELGTASSCSSDMGYHSDRSSGDHAVDTYFEPSEEQRRVGGAEGAAGGDSSEDIWTKVSSQPGVLRVFAAYETGLIHGTSVKLHVTPRTTSREVINLVVQQLNKAVMTRGLNAPIYSEDQLDEFCLVAVIGARERVMRDDYQPLQLQNPWTKGKLYVRLKSNLLAAIDHGHVTSV